MNHIAFGRLQNQGPIARLGYFAIQHQGVGAAVGGKAGLGASAIGFHHHRTAQILATNVDGGGSAILKRLHFDASDYWGKARAAAAGTY